MTKMSGNSSGRRARLVRIISRRTNRSVSKDFVMHTKISRKEAKESRYWLRLLDTAGDNVLEKRREILIQEANELMNIFGAILRKSHDQ